MNAPTIYLAGPIYGQTVGQANNWRKDFAAKLAEHGIVGISPLRCEPLVGETYDLSYVDPCFGQPKSILAKNFLDLRKCDFTLAFLPMVADGAQRSIGTIGEISWAYALQKPCAVVTDDPLIRHHPFTSTQPSWPLLNNLDEALRLLVGLYGGYAGGSNNV